MKLTKLYVLLIAPTVLTMFIALAGCGHDHYGHDRDRYRSPDRERHDYDRHDNGRHDDDRGDRLR